MFSPMQDVSVVLCRLQSLVQSHKGLESTEQQYHSRVVLVIESKDQKKGSVKVTGSGVECNLCVKVINSF